VLAPPAGAAPLPVRPPGDGAGPASARGPAAGHRSQDPASARDPAAGHRSWDPAAKRALLLLGAGGFLLAVFTDPGGALQAQYLRHQRHLSPLAISVLLQVTGTIGGAGTLVGGRLADTRGRRPVAAVGVAALTVTTLAVYLSGGAALWVWESVSSAVSYGIGPALGVYGAELFPAGLRARAGGVLTVAGAAGGLCGLAVAGVVSGRTGTVAPALAVLAVGPAAVALLVWRVYPETAGRTLVELHPGDA
jgi:MFS family permease